MKEGGIKEGFVDIRNKTCSCRVFQVDQFVCAHAIAVCLYFRVDPISFCSCYYTKETLVMTYSELIIPVGNMANWEITADVQTLQVNPPDVPSSFDCRKTRRIPSIGEDIPRSTITCGQCRECGHNRKNSSKFRSIIS